uniref:Cytochrome c assembly protein domain-containing protein n=1 Tax=Solanum lycopersicum TaxID=4081 RepID=A0A3Q7HJW3_SOLLC
MSSRQAAMVKLVDTLLLESRLLVTRWVTSGHFPLSDLYESLIFLSWSFSIINIIPYFKKIKITRPSAIFTQVVNNARKYDDIGIHNPFMSQLIQQLDYWSYRVISLGFTFLTTGILSVAVWANEAWGSYWNWEPKETWAFINWIVFSIYLHTQTNRNSQSPNSAILASIGFLIIWICYFGFNFTNKIRRLTSHLALHKKDYLSQRGLKKILGKRQRLRAYVVKK